MQKREIKKDTTYIDLVHFSKKLGKYGSSLLSYLKKRWDIVLIVLAALSFSTYLMYLTFHYKDGLMFVSSKVWGDFMSHIPLIRSFSKGDNIPPEYPLFPGEKIRYHFLFYMLVGLLEKAGFRIDLALNSLSILGLTGLIVGIYLLCFKLTKSKLASFLSSIFIVFNSSLSWIYYLFLGSHSQPQLIVHSFREIITNKEFAALGPYDGSLISVFWNLNIFTNQRHLAFSFLVAFLAIGLIFYKKGKLSFLLGIILIGTMAWLHKAMLLIIFVTLGIMMVAKKETRLRVLFGIAAGLFFALPGLLYLNSPSTTGNSLSRVQIGFLYNTTDWHEFKVKAGLLRWIIYWFLNMGILPLLAFMGFLAIDKTQIYKRKDKVITVLKNIFAFIFSEKRVWFLSAVSVFAVANIFVFAADPATNHKLINFTMFIFGIYAAYFLYILIKRKLILVSLVLFIFMTLGGIFDFFPVINDTSGGWPDLQREPAAEWIVENTPKDTKFFNGTYEIGPVDTAGRKVFYGWDYYHWSLGYDSAGRKLQMQPILLGEQPMQEVCSFLKKNSLTYIYLNKNINELFMDIHVDVEYFQENFGHPRYQDDRFLIYSVNDSCPNSN